ncbi:MAG: tetratricopeptide repeat protein [Akkermansiaceae bacterium]|nr:tetratricopeptide repeat protein [Akkermansiaceae bacterium]
MIAMCFPASGEEQEGMQVETLPKADDAIPSRVAALDAPATMDFPGGIRMAVSTSSKLAQKHVLQGLNHLHGGWELEATRHFAAAMREDPDCLLAHWGMAMALLDTSPENAKPRKIVVDRLIHLLDAGQGTELEQGYAYGLLKYLGEGADAAANAYRKVAKRFPNDMQAAIFSALFNRGGYDISGSATPDQLASEQQLLELIEKHPESPIPLNALLTIRAEAPKLAESLPMARKLAKQWPSYPPAFHLLGHYEWRSGNHARAAAAFGRASMLYQRWMKQNGLGVADCPEWASAESYRVIALLSMGDLETAHAAALQLAATPLPDDRLASPGAKVLLWDAKTLPARILIHRGLEEGFVEAAKALPSVDTIKPSMKHSVAYLWIDGLRLALEAQKLIDQGDIARALALVTALDLHMKKFSTTEHTALVLGERSEWLRARRALRILISDVRGRIAMAGAENMRATAFNWFTSGADFQRHESMLHPPMLLTPMSARLGDHFLVMGDPQKAIEHYQQALEMFPKDIGSLQGLKKAHLAAGNQEEAAAVDASIQELQRR